MRSLGPLSCPALLASAALAASSCAPAPTGAVDVCEEAALYREACTGEYTTPPVCEGEAAKQAEAIVAATCEELEAEASSGGGKADGAFCDWFGAACAADEPIFEGPQCQSDSDCAGGRYCAEGRCFAGVASDELAGVFDRFTDSSESTGDQVRLLVDNGVTRELRESMIARAEHSIHFTSLSISNARVSREMVAQLSEAVQRGVEVRVVVDAVAQDRFAGFERLEEMADAGVDVLVFNPIVAWARVRLGIRGLSINNRLHEKMLIVDGEEAIVGGRNTGAAFLTPGRAFDVDVHVQGPGVAAIQRMFARLWDRTSAWERDAGCPNASSYGFYCPTADASLQDDPAYFPPLASSGTDRTRTLYSEPFTQDPSHGYFTYVSLVRAARESVTIAAGYFIPSRRLLSHLREASQRGVTVRILKNSKDSTFYEYMYWASLNFYRELLGAGVDIREYQGPSMMHAKAMVVDGEVAVVGSYNVSPRSAQSNTEALILLRDSAAVGELQAALDAALDAAPPASADLSWRERLKARAHRSVEWLF